MSLNPFVGGDEKQRYYIASHDELANQGYGGQRQPNSVQGAKISIATVPYNSPMSGRQEVSKEQADMLTKYINAGGGVGMDSQGNVVIHDKDQTLVVPPDHRDYQSFLDKYGKENLGAGAEQANYTSGIVGGQDVRPASGQFTPNKTKSAASNLGRTMRQKQK